MKGVSPIIAAIVLIGIIITIGGMLAPWTYKLVTKSREKMENQTQSQILCKNMAYDFDYDYGRYGIIWNFDIQDGDWLAAKIINTGTVNVYDFFFEFEIEYSDGIKIKHFQLEEKTQKTKTSPLKPGESCVIKANITEDLPSGEYVLRKVRVMNRVCPNVYAVWESSI